MEYSVASFQPTDTNPSRGESLTVLEASRRAGVTQSAIIRWIRNGYLSATPSSNGWQIPASELAQAARAADEARGTAPVPRAKHPSLVPSQPPVPIRQNVVQRAEEASQKDIGEHIVAPLAELIRDQIDVVHDQAEVIGWLQAERSRLSAELKRLQSAEQSGDAADSTYAETRAELLADSELYDEVLSLLWKDDKSATEQTQTEQSSQMETVTVQQEHEEQPLEQLTVAGPPAALESFDLFSDDVPAQQDDALRLEDYADPSWFFGKRDIHPEEDQEDRPRATLQPIVPRKNAASREEESHLHQMIDETERKIAELWRSQEELRRTSPRAIDDFGDSDHRRQRANRWQRLWPLRR